MSNQVEQVDSLRVQGETVAAACKKVGIKPQEYFRRKRKTRSVASETKKTNQGQVVGVVFVGSAADVVGSISSFMTTVKG